MALIPEGRSLARESLNDDAQASAQLKHAIRSIGNRGRLAKETVAISNVSGMAKAQEDWSVRDFQSAACRKMLPAPIFFFAAMESEGLSLIWSNSPGLFKSQGGLS